MEVYFECLVDAQRLRVAAVASAVVVVAVHVGSVGVAAAWRQHVDLRHRTSHSLPTFGSQHPEQNKCK